MTIPCPDCHRLQIHALHCPNPQPLPQYAARTEPARCPDCASLTPGEHKPGCVVANATPLPCAVEVEAMRALALINPHEPGAQPIKVALTDTMLAMAFAEGWEL